MSNKDWDLENDMLLLNLLKQAQEAPAPAAPAPPKGDVISTARKMVSSLQRSLNNQGPLPNVQTPTPSAINIKNLNNFDQLVDYLINSKLTVDGKRVMLSAQEYNALDDAQKDTYDPTTVKTTRNNEEVDRRWEVTDGYTNINALVKYVQHLQNRAAELKESKNPETQIDDKTAGQMLDVLIGKIIDYINNNIQPNSGLSRKQKGQPGKPTDLPDATQLDWFVQPELDDSNVYANYAEPNPNNTNVLTVGDLRSRNTLNTWLAGYKFKSGGKPSNFDDFNHCTIMNILYARAVRRAEGARTEQLQKAAEWYMNKLKEIAPTFKAPDGTACSVGQTTDPKKQQPGQQPGGANVDPNILKKLIDINVFDVNSINLRNITDWVQLYANLVQGSRPGIAGLYNSIKQSIEGPEGLKKYVATTDVPIPTTYFQSYDRMKSFFSHGSPVMAIGWLIDIIRDAGSAYRDFFDSYGNVIRDLESRGTLPSGSYNKVLNQIGGTASPWAANLGQLMSANSTAVANDPTGKR